jgi:hypothetical protein
LPIARRDDGTVVYDHNGVVECASADEAILVASELARTAGYIAAIAFSRTSLPSMGYCGPGETLARFGQAWLV